LPATTHFAAAAATFYSPADDTGRRSGHRHRLPQDEEQAAKDGQRNLHGLFIVRPAVSRRTDFAF
jgi:hypothetical protein